MFKLRINLSGSMTVNAYNLMKIHAFSAKKAFFTSKTQHFLSNKLYCSTYSFIL